MHPRSEKNRKLIEQYPFVIEILESRLKPLAPHDGVARQLTSAEQYRATKALAVTLDDLTIKVQVADGELMFRQPRNAGVSMWEGENNNSFLISKAVQRRGQVGRRGEYLFTVFKDGKVDLFLWRTPSPRPYERPHYPKLAFWGNVDPNFRSNPRWDEIEYLVWVEINAWYTDTLTDDAPDGRFGRFQNRSATVTIYRAPKQGFEKLDVESHEIDFLQLNSDVLFNGYVENDRVVTAIGNRVDELCLLFVDDVWRNGLLDAYNQIELRGMSGKIGSTSLRVYYIAGRNVVTLEDEVCQITFKGDYARTDLGVQSLYGTLPQLRELIKRVVRQWNHHPEWRSEVQPDKNVSIL